MKYVLTTSMVCAVPVHHHVRISGQSAYHEPLCRFSHIHTQTTSFRMSQLLCDNVPFQRESFLLQMFFPLFSIFLFFPLFSCNRLLPIKDFYRRFCEIPGKRQNIIDISSRVLYNDKACRALPPISCQEGL